MPEACGASCEWNPSLDLVTGDKTATAQYAEDDSGESISNQELLGMRYSVRTHLAAFHDRL